MSWSPSPAPSSPVPKRPPMRRTGLFVLLFAATGCSGGKWREVDARLLSASQEARRAGFLPLSGPYNTFGSYRDVLEHTWRVGLEARTPYVLAAACTDGCDSLAIRIAAPGGSPVTGAGPAGGPPRAALTAPPPPTPSPSPL